jgi:hypothetical protein
VGFKYFSWDSSNCSSLSVVHCCSARKRSRQPALLSWLRFHVRVEARYEASGMPAPTEEARQDRGG